MLTVLSMGVAFAEGCPRRPLAIRQVLPPDGTVDVPLDTRLVIPTIGYGTVEDFDVVLSSDSGQVELEQRSWCYEHEGPDELHCWQALKPVGDLAAETSFEIVVTNTESWTGDGVISRRSQFTTGSEHHGALEGRPSGGVDEAWTQHGLVCAWPQTRRYWMTFTEVPDSSGLGLLHFMHLPEGGDPVLVHTLYLDGSTSGAPVKQYLDARQDPSDCFQLVQEDGSGSWSEPSETFCWTQPEQPGDTGDSTGDSTGAIDSEPPAPRDRRQPYTPGCGCVWSAHSSAAS